MTTIDLERNDLADTANGVWGGRSEWKINKFLTNTSYLGDYSNKVVPVFAMDRILPSYENRWWGRIDKDVLIGGNEGVPVASLYDNSKLKEYGFMYKIFNRMFRDVVQQILSEDNPGAMPHRHWHSSSDSNVVTEVTNAIQQASVKISIALSDCVSQTSKEFTDLPKEYGMPEISARHRWGGYWRYVEIIGHFLRGNGWQVHKTRTWTRDGTLKYLVGSYFIADITDSDSIVPIIALVTKPKYLEYIKYSLALSKKIDKRVFQVWVNPLFDIPRSRWRGLRSHIRKEFLVPMYDAGIPIVEKDSFKELFKSIVLPEMANLNDYKKWLHECSIESINNLKTNIN